MRPTADAVGALLEWTSTGPAAARGVCRFPAALPVLTGHFPGAPLVPGVYLLAVVAELAGRALGHGVEIVAVERAKWSAPAYPERVLTVTVDWRDGTAGIVLDGTVADGAVACATCRLLVTRR